MRYSKKYCIKIGNKCKKLTHSQLKKLCGLDELNKKPVITILLGAGAASIWNGPSTSEINSKFEEDTTYSLEDGRTVGSIIFDRLRDHYGRSHIVNFETFINLLEQIYDFVISESNEGGTDPTNTSMLPLLFNLNDLTNEIYNPHNQNLPNLHLERDPVIRKRIYFGDIIKHYLRIIRSEINNYEWPNDINAGINSALYQWLSSIRSKFSIRMYTTNYDRIIPEILDHHGQSYFDGFNRTVTNGRSIPDVQRICHNSDDIIYYQLHGSTHWEVAESDFSVVDFRLVREGIPVRDLYSFHMGSPGQILLKTNIITGYSKPQRIMQSPINAMYSSFLQDCMRASYILTSGFSFGDPHLKKIIINSLFATNTKFLNITNKENVGELEEYFGSGIYDDISSSLDIHFGVMESEHKGNWLIKGNRYFAYYGGFASFLENNAWDILYR